MKDDFKVSFTVTNVKDGTGRLQMRIRWAGGNIASNVGYEVNVGKWDADRQECVNNTTHGRKKVAASVINKEIRRRRILFSEVAELCTESSCSESVRRMFDEKLGKVSNRAGDSAVAALDDFVRREGRLRMWTENTRRKYGTLRYSLIDWKGDGLRLSQLDARGIEDYFLHLVDEGKRNDTIDKYMMSLRAFLRWAGTKGGYNLPKGWEDCDLNVKTARKTVVWLTMEEIGRLYDMDIRKELSEHVSKSPQGNAKDLSAHEAVRDAFCLSCYTGMRYSDIFALKPSDIRGGKIHLSIRKTGEVVTIELNRRSREIVDRYSHGRKDAPMLPYHPNPVCNKIIKRLCAYARIDEPTTVTFLAGNERTQETKPKYELVTMHTGRRSFICNALEKGISPDVIMKWTGHKSYDEMRPYIDISDRAKESAMLLFDRD